MKSGKEGKEGRKKGIKTRGAAKNGDQAKAAAQMSCIHWTASNYERSRLAASIICPIHSARTVCEVKGRLCELERSRQDLTMAI